MANNGDIIQYGLAEEYLYDQVERENYYVGYVRRYSPDGERKWSRIISDKRDGGFYYEFYGGAEDLSGDLIFTGWLWDTIRPPEDPFTDHVWLVKLDSNGCFTPDCIGEFQTLVSSKEIALAPSRTNLFGVLPNPTQGHITLGAVFGAHLPKGIYTARINNATGRAVKTINFDPNILNEFSVAELPPGPCFMEVLCDGIVVQAIKFIKG